MQDVNEYGNNEIYRIEKTICQSCLSNNDNMVFHAIYSSHSYKKSLILRANAERMRLSLIKKAILLRILRYAEYGGKE
jgi:hypothetical protein